MALIFRIDRDIAGTIREDPLGLDEVYIQAKRYARDHQVGVSDVRNFAGTLDTTSTRKGVFVATSGFTRNAEEYVALSPKRIVLINGEKLARLLAKHGIGARLSAVNSTALFSSMFRRTEATGRLLIA